MSEQELKRAFANAVAEVKPLEAPYRRLMERRQTRRGWKLGGWLSGGVAAVVAVLLGPVGLLNPAAPQPAPSALPSPTKNDVPVDLAEPAWGLSRATPGVQQLLNTPPRGALAKDKAFSATLLNELTQRLRSKGRNAKPQILLAEDVGNMRVVVVAYVGTDAGITRQAGALLVAERGASAQRLASAEDSRDRADGRSHSAFSLSPYTRIIIPENFFPPSVQSRGFVEIGLAPQGCRITTAMTASPVVWRDQQLGDYFVDTSGQQHYADRVTCGGKIRAQVLDYAYYNFAGTRAWLTETEMTAAIADARGNFTSAEAREILNVSNTRYGQRWVGFPAERRLLFGGTLPSLAHRRLFVSMVEREKEYEILVHFSAIEQPNQQYIPKEFLGPKSVLAVPINGWQPGTTQQGYIVLAPRGAVRLDYKIDGEAEWNSSSMKDGVGEIEVDGSRITRFVARDAKGAIVGEGSNTRDFPREERPYIEEITWNE